MKNTKQIPHLEAPWNWGFGVLQGWHIQDKDNNYIAEVLSNGTDIGQAEEGTGFEIAKLIAVAPEMRDVLYETLCLIQNEDYENAIVYLEKKMANINFMLDLEENE